MDLGRIMVRVLFGYLWTLALLRVSGKRTIRQSDVPSFVVALVLGDMFDDLFWAEVSVAQFVTGATALVTTHLWVAATTAGIIGRQWQRESSKSRNEICGDGSRVGCAGADSRRRSGTARGSHDVGISAGCPHRGVRPSPHDKAR